jgi:hypothetical protein
MGNREVPRIEILIACGDVSGAWDQACPEEEGGMRGKPGFPRTTEPEAEEAA